MLRLIGISASPGIGGGAAWVLPRPGQPIRRQIDDRNAELARFRDAVAASRRDLEQAGQALRANGNEAALVLDAQLLMHGDEMLTTPAETMIRDEGSNAEWAIHQVVRGLMHALEASQSSYFRERAQDVRHVGRHIRRHLRGEEPQTLPESGGPFVVVASDLSPADAVRLLQASPEMIAGLAIEAGSATSHTAILARALQTPSVVGVTNLLASVQLGASVVVDGFLGEVQVDADAQDLASAQERGARHDVFLEELIAKRDEPARTQDNQNVIVRANLELVSEAAGAVARGARGVGLFRTEFLFLDRATAPSEDEQRLAYSSVVRALGLSEPVTFRTFDLGGDKLPRAHRLPPSANPALGLRAIRLSLRRPSLLRTQFRAMLHAHGFGKVRILLPLVSGIQELLEARAHLNACIDELGMRREEVEVGAMVELPSAALLVDRLVPHVDFLTVGTNDLVQYAIGVDRGNPEVAHLGECLHPAVLRLLRMIIRDAADTPVSCCGDMAAEPAGLAALIGVGFREVSVPVPALPVAQELVRQVSTHALRELTDEALDCDSPETTRRRLTSYLAEQAPGWLERVDGESGDSG